MTDVKEATASQKGMRYAENVKKKKNPKKPVTRINDPTSSKMIFFDKHLMFIRSFFSLIFSYHSISVKIKADLWSIPGAQGARHEYTLNITNPQ